jgi:hypothetical protein
MQDIEFHSLYVKGFEPVEMRIDSPFAPQYPPKNPDGTDPPGTIILLYVRSFKYITGSEPLGIYDLKIPFNHPYVEGAPGITASQLDIIVDSLLSPEPPPTKDEVQINILMTEYLYTTRFPPVDEANI